jgi:hypothetical protein
VLQGAWDSSRYHTAEVVIVAQCTYHGFLMTNQASDKIQVRLVGNCFS